MYVNVYVRFVDCEVLALKSTQCVFRRNSHNWMIQLLNSVTVNTTIGKISEESVNSSDCSCDRRDSQTKR